MEYMPRLGTWSTFDAPTKEMSPESTEAMKWLNENLPEDASARFMFNPHDFGTYLSIEVDMSTEMMDIQSLEDEGEELTEEEYNKFNAYILEMNRIEKEYSEKFIK